jgi:NADPH:quinone reductase
VRAVVCSKLGRPDLLAIEDLADPQPGPDQVLVEVRAAGLNFPDLLMIQGLYQVKLDPPFVPGGEASGVIVATGDGVIGFAAGDPVMFNSASDGQSMSGAFAERCAVNVAQLVPMPRSMSFEQGAGFVIAYGTAYHALKQRAQLQTGETLLVLGAAGGVGAAAVEIGKALGGRVIAAASSPEKLDFTRALGADDVIDYSRAGLRDAVRALTDGRGVDVVFDPVGGVFTEQAVRSTAWRGRHLVIGFAAGEIPRVPLNLALLKGMAIVGVYWGAFAAKEPERSRQNFAELSTMVDSGRITPRVSEVYPLEAFTEAFAAIEERRALGKVVLRVT